MRNTIIQINVNVLQSEQFQYLAFQHLQNATPQLQARRAHNINNCNSQTQQLLEDNLSDYKPTSWATPTLAFRSQMGRIRSRTGSVLRSLAERRPGHHSKNEKRQPNGVNALANEHKATRVLAVVFICFFICWTPFFLVNFTVGFCGNERCRVPDWAMTLFLWLGYLSSTINPIIYTIFNRRFRQAFLRILSCEWVCRHRHHHQPQHPYRGAYSTTNEINKCNICWLCCSCCYWLYGSRERRERIDYYSNYSKTHTYAGGDMNW